MCLAVPGKITAIFQANDLLMGKIDFGGVVREVCLSYVPDARVGDYALVHVGFALNLLSEEEAHRTLELLQQISRIDQEAGLV